MLHKCRNQGEGEGRTFSHRIIEMLGHFTGGKRYLSLSKCFKADLEWWLTFAQWFNGSAKIVQPFSIPAKVLVTDASGSGFGGVSGGDWFCGAWESGVSLGIDEHGHGVPKPAMYIPNNINVRELYPILEAIWRWGPDWRDRKVVCYSDNTQVVAAINTGLSANRVAWICCASYFGSLCYVIATWSHSTFPAARM